MSASTVNLPGRKLNKASGHLIKTELRDDCEGEKPVFRVKNLCLRIDELLCVFGPYGHDNAF